MHSSGESAANLQICKKELPIIHRCEKSINGHTGETSNDCKHLEHTVIKPDCPPQVHKALGLSDLIFSCNTCMYTSVSLSSSSWNKASDVGSSIRNISVDATLNDE